MNRISDTEATLARWHEEAAAVRSRRSGIGVARPEQVEGLSGMQVFEAMMAGRLPAPPIGQTLDFELVQVEPGMAVFQGRPGPAHYNPMGTVHGGWFATLLDSAVGCAVHTLLEQGMGYTTLELKVNYLRALGEDTGPVRAEGRVVHTSRQIGVADGSVHDAAGRLYAHATTTCLIFPLPTG